MTNEPKGGWDKYARENPYAPLSKDGAASYLNHLIDGGNDRIRAINEYKKNLAKWEARSWFGRLIFPRPRCP